MNNFMIILLYYVVLLSYNNIGLKIDEGVTDEELQQEVGKVAELVLKNLLHYYVSLPRYRDLCIHSLYGWITM